MRPFESLVADAESPSAAQVAKKEDKEKVRWSADSSGMKGGTNEVDIVSLGLSLFTLCPFDAYVETLLIY